MRSKYRKYVLFLLYCGMMLWLLLARTPNEAGVPFSIYFHTHFNPVPLRTIRRFSRLLVLLSSLLAACVTAFAGPISFVGIAVPHLVKQLLGSARPLYVLPGCCFGGAAFCLLCDLIARSLFAPMELSISAVTAVFGAPVGIGLLLRRNREDVR